METTVIDNTQGFKPNTSGNISTYTAGSYPQQTSPTAGNVGDPATIKDGTVVQTPAVTTVPNTTDAQPKEKELLGVTGNKQEQPETFDSTGNAVIDSGVQLLAQHGLTKQLITDALSDAIDSGNISDIKKDLIKEKLGAVYGEYAVALAEQYVTHQIQQNNAVVTSVYNAVGGEEAWTSLRDRFKVLADPSMVDVVSTMLNSGKAVEAATFIKNYVQASGTIPVGVNTLSKGTASIDEALSKEAFLAENDKLQAQAKALGENFNSAKYTKLKEDLFRRRKLGMTRGI